MSHLENSNAFISARQQTKTYLHHSCQTMPLLKLIAAFPCWRNKLSQSNRNNIKQCLRFTFAINICLLRSLINFNWHKATSPRGPSSVPEIDATGFRNRPSATLVFCFEDNVEAPVNSKLHIY